MKEEDRSEEFGPFHYLHELGIAEHALNRVILHVTLAAQDLNGIGGYFHRHIRGEAI